MVKILLLMVEDLFGSVLKGGTYGLSGRSVVIITNNSTLNWALNVRNDP